VDILQAKKEGQLSSKERQRQGDIEFQLLYCRWDSLMVSPDDLLMMMLTANNHQQKRDHIVCPRALWRELI